MIRLKEIAEECGVNISTVSRALKGDVRVKGSHPETFLCKLTTPSILPSIRLERVDDLRFAFYLVRID